MEEILNIILEVEPVTWGVNDRAKRDLIRTEIAKIINDFSPTYIESLIKRHKQIEIEINAYLTKPEKKDIDNLSKIPIDALFFSAENEPGYKNWENKINSLIIKKIRSDIIKSHHFKVNSLSLIIYYNVMRFYHRV